MSWASALTAVASVIFPIIKHAMAVTSLTLDRLDELEAQAVQPEPRDPRQQTRAQTEVLRRASEHLRRRRKLG